jgi:hypothetical protein
MRRTTEQVARVAARLGHRPRAHACRLEGRAWDGWHGVLRLAAWREWISHRDEVQGGGWGAARHGSGMCFCGVEGFVRLDLALPEADGVFRCDWRYCRQLSLCQGCVEKDQSWRD